MGTDGWLYVGLGVFALGGVVGVIFLLRSVRRRR